MLAHVIELRPTRAQERLDEGPQTVEMPAGAVILSTQAQRGEICIWAAVSPDDSPQQKRRFQVFGTGQEIDLISARFLGTIQIGAFVAHVFEL